GEQKTLRGLSEKLRVSGFQNIVAAGKNLFGDLVDLGERFFLRRALGRVGENADRALAVIARYGKKRGLRVVIDYVRQTLHFAIVIADPNARKVLRRRPVRFSEAHTNVVAL